MVLVVKIKQLALNSMESGRLEILLGIPTFVAPLKIWFRRAQIFARGRSHKMVFRLSVCLLA